MNPAREARVGLTPRTGGEDDVVWRPVAPGYAFHVANAHGVAVSVVLIVTLPVPIYLVAGPALWTAAYRRRRVAAPNH